jgi:hypothetical protein
MPWWINHVKIYTSIRNSIKSWHHRWKLNSLFIALNDYTNKKLLNRCMWLSQADGRTIVYNYPDSIAHHLDTLQRELLRSRINCLTICGISINAEDEFEHVVWSRTLAVHFAALLERLLQDQWSGSYEKIAEFVASMEDTSAEQLTWQPRLPSAIALSPEKPSLFGIDVLLNWVQERPGIDTFLGFEDWSIYLSEPYTRRPILSALRIVMATSKGSTKHRLMLMTTSGGMLARLKKEQDQIIEANSTGATIVTEDQIVKLLLASIALVIDKTIQYISDVMKVLQALVKKSFSYPGTSLMTHNRTCLRGRIPQCPRCSSYYIFASATNGRRKPATETFFKSPPSFNRTFRRKKTFKNRSTISNILLERSRAIYNRWTASERPLCVRLIYSRNAVPALSVCLLPYMSLWPSQL